MYAVATIHQALELFTGMPAGAMNEDHRYPEGSLLRIARRRARAFWEQAAVGGPAAVRTADQNDET